MGDTLFFAARDGGYYSLTNELWSLTIDRGIPLIAKVDGASPMRSPGWLTATGRSLFLAGYEPRVQTELWRVSIALFSDGFETGDTSTWTAAE